MKKRIVTGLLALPATVALVLAGCGNAAGSLKGGGAGLEAVFNQNGEPVDKVLTGEYAGELLGIRGGTFLMGDDSLATQPAHRVRVDSFYLGAYEVTNELYKSVTGVDLIDYTKFDGRPWRGTAATLETLAEVGETPETWPADASWFYAVVFCNKLSILEGLDPVYTVNGKTNPDEWGTVPEHMFEVEYVTTMLGDQLARVLDDYYVGGVWDIAMVPGANGYRLPTEAEWEYAYRAGTATTYYTGDTLDPGTAWFYPGGSDESRNHSVGMKAANPWGLYDMAGNAEEWVWDRYAPYTAESQFNPAGPAAGDKRVVRGGTVGNPVFVLSAAARVERNPYVGAGFRLARSGK